jgi:hypothetical protein
MKLNRAILKDLIREALQEDNGEEKATALKTGAMTGGQFVTKGREQRVDADPEVDNNERSILNQIDEFLLGLAAKPGVDLQAYRLQFQTFLQRIEAMISKGAPTNTQAPTPGVTQGDLK